MGIRLQTGEIAPLFSTNDFVDRKTGIEHFRGSYLLLSFYRYASCPLCNMRVHELSQNIERFNSLNLKLLAIFQSPKDSMARYVGRQEAPFPIIADPTMKLYKQYGVGKSWSGFLKGALRISTFLKAFSNDYWIGKMEGSISRIPADFLISPEGKIICAYYGKDMGDHVPINTLIDKICKEIQD
jgi:thioredoxin-dependent peroxiredoxin